MQRILRLAEDVAASATAANNRRYSTDLVEDTSTPDQTSGSECLATSHLAEQEAAFSDDQHISATASATAPATLAEVRLHVPLEHQPPERAQFPADSPDDESHIVYRESEADNSCIDMEEEEEDDEEEEERQMAVGARSARTGTV